MSPDRSNVADQEEPETAAALVTPLRTESRTVTLTAVPASVVPLTVTPPAVTLFTYIGALMLRTGAWVSLISVAVAAVLVFPAASFTVAA